MKNLLFVLLCAVSLVLYAGCVSGNVSEGACDMQDVSFPLPVLPTPPVNAPTNWSFTLPALTAPPITEDFSGTISKVSDVATSVNVMVNSLTLDSQNLSWVSGITISIAGIGSNYPMATLATYTPTPGSNVSSLTSQVVMPNSTLLSYLESGPVTLSVTIASSTVDATTVQQLQALNGNVNASINLCITASANVSKSL